MTYDNTLPPDFNPQEFAPLSLLERGDVDVWVRRRGAILLDKSKDVAKDCEASKLASALTIGASVVMSSNPLAWLPLTIGALGYVYTIFQEFQDTGSIRLIPMYRGKLGDILSIMEGGQAAQRHPLEDQIEYLSEAEKDEVLLVNYRFGEIASILNSAPPKVRFDLYRHLCGQFHARRDIITADEAKHYITNAVSEARRVMPPIQEQPAIGQNPQLNAHEAKSETVSESVGLQAAASTPPASPAPTTTPSSTKWIDNFIRQTALIWGNQGSGKSWMARYIAKRKKDEGYRVVVLDPDSNRAEWEGVESYHDFEEIAEFLAWYVEELKARYKAFNASTMTEDAWRAKLWADGKALALICEEVTTYADLIEDKELLTQFFRLGLTKSRKQEMPLTFVSHNNNQTALGGIKGLANLIDKMLQLELQTSIDPETLQPVASGKGTVKLDGSNQWVPVVLPKLEQKITNFGEAQAESVERSINIPERSEKPSHVAEPDDVERLNALISKPKSDSEPPEPLNLEPLNLDPFSPEITPQERGSVVSFRRSGRSKEETVFLVWGAKKGGSKAYLAAKEKLDRIIKESGCDG
ncbi:MAG TPA: hypothetical protein V6D26_08465 [Stenomitos sp.]